MKTPQILKRVSPLIRQARQAGFTGSLLIAVDGEIVLHEGYGWANSNHTVPVTTQTPYWIASITKQFTAAAILKLEEQGRLTVNDPIQKFIQGMPEDTRSITLHQLLTHTAGLRQNYAADGIIDRDEAVRAILAEPLQSPPGEGFGYSNDAYNLLAALISIISGEIYETYLRRELFEPAGLGQTGFWGSATHAGVAEITKLVSPEVRQPNWGFRGAVGIHSTPGDLYHWYLELQANRVLSQASRQKALSPHVTLREGEHAGYGWFLTCTPWGSTKIWTRGTEDFGHNAILVAYPEEKVVLSAASNAGDWDGIAFSRRLVENLEEGIFT